MKQTIALLVSLTAAACAPGATMTTPEVNSPVTFGPVTRIGGHRAGGEKVVATVAGEASDFAAASRTERDLGNGLVEVKQETTKITIGADVVSSQILAKTENDARRETRIDNVGVGAYFFITPGSAMAERWVSVNGRVVEVEDAR